MNSVNELCHFVGKRLHISLKEEVKRLIGNATVFVDISNVCRSIVSRSSLTARAEYLKSLVIAIASLTAVVDNADCTALEFKGNKRSINVACLTDCRVYHNGCVCINLFNLAADKTSHIKIMNCHIKEDTAGYLYIINTRRLRVTGGNLNCLKITELALVCKALNLGKVVVISSVKTDLKLNACLFYCGNNLLNLRNRQINRLFAENVLSCLGSLNCYICVSVG